MNQRTTRSRYVEIGFGRKGGFLATVVEVLSGIAAIVLALLFAALFLGLLVVIAIGVAVRAWLLGNRGRRAQPDVIEGQYTVIDPGDSRHRHRP